MKLENESKSLIKYIDTIKLYKWRWIYEYSDML